MTELERVLSCIDGNGQYSGGCMPLSHMKEMEDIADDEGVIYYHTKWLPTNFPDEEKQVIIFQRCRKKELS